MKRFDIITCLPSYFHSVTHYGVTRVAFANQWANLVIHDLRQYGQGNHKAIDDRPFGGFDGMVLAADPIATALENIDGINEPDTVLIYFSPQGERLNQRLLIKFYQTFNRYILLCGRYAGVDQRVINYFGMKEISIGDYVLSGGELPAMVFIDGIVRLIPGTLGNQQSVSNDSFSGSEQHLLEPPLFTRPRKWRGQNVPDILISGNHKEINIWKRFVSLIITKLKRPDLFDQILLSHEEKNQLIDFITCLTEGDKKALGIPTNLLDDLKFDLTGRKHHESQ
ncbi:MAG: tRNA (guanosine(37)-N1)-methyltransferase TrmD [Bdellovibrionaceae bacterium]|nr:tRNA (guanosine(37)-N1)-methyltransferase TrmD [Pseudobdellovibrionaceae bacterium]MDW8191234.1 tRNA (guanosine(37)-N1)-methyltransferase TrmD [Pseudobdellovibrionaceae bacterium]